jgi:hypothetical protein
LPIHTPPKYAAKPSARIDSEKIRLTLATDLSKCSDSGTRKTLQA